jgi:MarR family transcriptional regulator, organic hydroperoxide resistance regulator
LTEPKVEYINQMSAATEMARAAARKQPAAARCAMVDSRLVPRPMRSPPPEVSVVDALLTIMGQLGHEVGAVAEEHGLTPQQLFLLRNLRAPRPMHEVAAELCCDPSNVTGLIDRLEARGLVERIPGAVDRRVKMLSLTSEGKVLRRKVEADLARRLTPKGADSKAEEAIERVRRLLTSKAEGDGG